MATDIVQSLFGVTPDMYQQRQAQQADARALQFAQLTPMQQAQYGIGRGAYGLAGAIGGALGAQDPELQRISARNSIAQQIDYNNPTSIMDGQRALARLGDTVGAMQLATIGRDLEYKQAQTSQSMAAAGASRAQTVKTQAEIDEIARQQKAYAALSGGTPVAAAAAPMAAPGMLEGEIAVDNYGKPYEAAIPSAIAPRGAMEQPVAAAAAAQTRPALNEQIAELERRREQLLALNKISGAKAQAEMLGDQIKDLRGQLKPTEITDLEREISQFRNDGVPDTDPRIKVRQDKITKLSSSGADRFGAEREAISVTEFEKPFLQLTQEQRKVVNQILEESKGRTAERGAAKFVMPGDKTLADIPAFRRSVQQTIAPQLSTITAAKQALQSINDSITTGNFVSFNAARTQLARSLGDSQLSRRDIEQAGGDPSILGGLIDLTSRAITSTPSLDTQKKIQATLQAIQTVARKQAQGEVDQQRRIALRSPGYNPEAVNEALMFPELQGGAAPAATGGDLAAQAAAELARRRGGK
jgi:hypothetical protein